MIKVKKEVLYILAGITSVLIVFLLSSVLLQPFRDQHAQDVMQRLDAMGTIEGIHVHYEGTCSVVDNQEETIEITSIVCDPLIYKSRQDIPQKCPESAKRSICGDIKTQLRALNIANYESIPISISIICEE